VSKIKCANCDADAYFVSASKVASKVHFCAKHKPKSGPYRKIPKPRPKPEVTNTVDLQTPESVVEVADTGEMQEGEV